MKYNKTTWIDGVTPLSAEHLNNIEDGIENIYNATINGKALSNNPSLTAADVNALPDSTKIPIVDKNFSASSENAQSGKAVAEAIDLLNIKNSIGSSSLQQTRDAGFETLVINNETAIKIDPMLAQGQHIGATGKFASAFGGTTSAQGNRSFSCGSRTISKGDYSHTEGVNSVALGDASHSEGHTNVAQGKGAHAEGYNTIAQGDGAHTEGARTSATGNYSHAEGSNTVATKDNAHAEGAHTESNGHNSHSEGNYTVADRNSSHAEGYKSHAKGIASHTEGSNTVAEKDYSHAEGYYSVTDGLYAHAQGFRTTANGEASHSGGRYTVAGYDDQTVIGRFNSNKEDTLFEVGCGASEGQRENCFEAGKNQNGKFIRIGNTQITEDQLKQLLTLVGDIETLLGGI